MLKFQHFHPKAVSSEEMETPTLLTPPNNFWELLGFWLRGCLAVNKSKALKNVKGEGVPDQCACTCAREKEGLSLSAFKQPPPQASLCSSLWWIKDSILWSLCPSLILHRTSSRCNYWLLSLFSFYLLIPLFESFYSWFMCTIILLIYY